MKKLFLFMAFTLPVFGLAQKITVSDAIELTLLPDSVFIHTSYHEVEGWGRVASNGLLVVKNGRALMVDTPMDTELTKELLEYLKEEMSIEVVKFVAGHFHNDCIGGIDYIHEQGIESISSAMTARMCKEEGLTIPKINFEKYLKVDVNGREVYCEYYGPGHTWDNIVVWVPDANILFGGCMVKGKGATNIGNVADAAIKYWDQTVDLVRMAYPTLKIVVPGHGSYGGFELFDNTISLVKNYRKNR